MKYIIAFDPGETVGVCILAENGDVQHFQQVKINDLTQLLKSLKAEKLDKVILEKYVIFRSQAKKHIGSDGKTMQCIGRIKTWAELNDLEVIEQPANILPMAQKKTQVKIPSDHSVSHQVSAYLHGAWYLMGQGTMLSALQKEALRKTALEQGTDYEAQSSDA